MKRFLALLLLTTALSCSKDKDKTCWTCIVHYPLGDRTETPCTDGRGPKFMDTNNNPVAADCVRR